MPDKFAFDFDKVTSRMLDDFERETGTSLFEFMVADGLDVSKLSGKSLAGVIWLAMRTSGQPDATFEDAMDTPVVLFDVHGGAEVDPTPAGSES